MFVSTREDRGTERFTLWPAVPVRTFVFVFCKKYGLKKNELRALDDENER